MALGSGEMKHNILELIIPIILTISICCCINDSSKDTPQEEKSNENNYLYTLDLNFTDNDVLIEDFYLIIPFPVSSNNELIREISNTFSVDDLKVSVKIEYTKYGPGINVSGNGTLFIQSEGYLPSSPAFPLSLQNDTDDDGDIFERNGIIEFWVYSSIDIPSMKIYYQGKSDYGGTVLKINTSISEGWQIIIGEGYCGGG